MYQVNFMDGDMVVATVTHSAGDEDIWTAAGFELTDRYGQRAEDFEMDIVYVLDQIDDQDVLDFLGKLITTCIEHPSSTIRVK